MRDETAAKQEEGVVDQFVSVLRTMFDCVLEFDLERNELTLWFSRLHPVKVPMTCRFTEFVEDVRRVAYDGDDADRLVMAFEQCRESGANVPVVCRCRLHISHVVMWMEATFTRVSERKVFCCANDVTDRVVADRKYAWSNERYRILSELTSAVSFDYDSSADMATFFFDRSVVSATGGEEDVRTVCRYLEDWPESRGGVIHPCDMAAVFDMLERAQMGSDVEVEDYRADYYGEGCRWYRGRVRRSCDRDGVWHLIGSIDDVQDTHDLRYRAERDSLTGLLNHGAIMDVVSAHLAANPAGAGAVCAIVDIDNFKCVNDAFGHLFGDEVLLSVGKFLLERCADRAYVGRVGGDEFLLFFAHEGLDEALSFLESVRSEMVAIETSGVERLDACDILRPQEDAVRMTISVGVTEVCPTDRTIREVVLRSDRALYDAKNSGKNRVCTR